MTLDDLAQIVFRATGAPLSLEEAEQIARAVVLALADDIDGVTLWATPQLDALQRLRALVEEARAAEVVQSP